MITVFWEIKIAKQTSSSKFLHIWSVQMTFAVQKERTSHRLCQCIHLPPRDASHRWREIPVWNRSTSIERRSTYYWNCSPLWSVNEDLTVTRNERRVSLSLTQVVRELSVDELQKRMKIAELLFDMWLIHVKILLLDHQWTDEGEDKHMHLPFAPSNRRNTRRRPPRFPWWSVSDSISHSSLGHSLQLNDASNGGSGWSNETNPNRNWTYCRSWERHEVSSDERYRLLGSIHDSDPCEPRLWLKWEFKISSRIRRGNRRSYCATAGRLALH